MTLRNSKSIRTGKGNPLVLGAYADGNDTIFSIDCVYKNTLHLALYRKDSESLEEPILIPFKREYTVGNINSMRVKKINMDEYMYTYIADGVEFADPYAKIIYGNEVYDSVLEGVDKVYSGILNSSYDWEGDERIESEYSELIIYELHVRGFTQHVSSKVAHRGTYSGIIDKIEYLHRLGINAVELMPSYEFLERELKDSHAAMYQRPQDDDYFTNYWGYKNAFYFAPKASYAHTIGAQVDEFKDMVRALHKNGISVIMQFYFTEDRGYNYIIECLRYWVMEYHIDGIHLMGNDSYNYVIASDPLLADVKIITNNWNSASCSQDKNLANSNDGFMVDMRKFLKGDGDMLAAVARRVRDVGNDIANVNYIAYHNGFTLNDLVTYDRKHNEANYKGNNDGSDYNYSWNCGYEGPTRKVKIHSLRNRQLRNALLLLMLSQGTPLIQAGDESGRTKRGNNNSYCHDNDISYINWKLNKNSKRLLDFTQRLIDFRKEHKVFHQDREYRIMDYLSCGYPDMSYHGTDTWYPELENYNRHFAVMYCGKYAKAEEVTDSTFYVAYNMHWEEHEFNLPTIRGEVFYKVIDTSCEYEDAIEDEPKSLENPKKITLQPRSIVVLQSCKKDL